jgi:predicted SAM-dependent methyltransferase
VRRFLLFTFSHRTVVLLRWDVHFLFVRFQNWISGKERGLLRSLSKAQPPIYLNLGSGPRGVVDSHWINVDGYWDINVHYLMDFGRKWPFPDNCLNGIFCEHVFEHFDLEHGYALLREALRVLQPGGSVRIIVPDGAKILRTYCENPSELSSHRQTETGHAMEAVNSYFRQRYEHQFIYDGELLIYQLARAGFNRIELVSYGVGEVSRSIILDDQKYSWESLYVEAAKPAKP